LKIFDEDITWLRAFIDRKSSQGTSTRKLDAIIGNQQISDILEKKGAAIVLKEDTWLELGNPGSVSTALALVTDQLDLVSDGAITLIGPDIPETKGSLPFAQILLIASEALQDEDYRGINTFQHELEFAGYMIKSIPSSLNLWSRVSKSSVADGFSFETLGKAIINSYKSRFNHPSVELIFVTSSKADVEELKDLQQKVTRIISAMNKMMEELSFDCSSCEYLDVCGDVRQLGALREKLMKQKQMRSQ